MGIGIVRALGFCAACMGIGLAAGCSDSSGSGNSTPVSDTLLFQTVGTQEWATLSVVADTTIIQVDSETLRLWWTEENVSLHFAGTNLFQGAKFTFSYLQGNESTDSLVFKMDILQGLAEMNVTEEKNYDFRLKLALQDGRVVLIYPDQGLALVSQVHLGGGVSSSEWGSSSSQVSSSSSQIQVNLQAGIWGGSYSKADSTVTMVLQLLANQSMVLTMRYDWITAAGGCKKLEYKGSWRQDLWVLTLDRATVAQYRDCSLGYVAATQDLVEDPLAMSINFQDENATEMAVQWPDAGTWVMLSQNQ